ncbi:MAG: TerB family tellurite resistance protein [Pirellulaceae bacterium]
MIIVGSIELKFTKGIGIFACPTCEQERTYRHRTRREFLTLYFIPLIPLQARGEFIECMTCRGTFPVELAEMTVERLQQQKRQHVCELIRRVLVTIVALDNEVTDEELEAVREFAADHGQPAITREQILQEAVTVRAAQFDPLAYIRAIAPQLGADDKETLLYYAFLAATAAGELSETRQDFLAQLPEAVGVPEMRFREIVLRAVGHR